MRGVNKVILIGTMGADPEVRNFDNGGSITNISLATSEQWTDKQSGEKREATEWHRVSMSGRLAEIAAQYTRKGSKVYIEGKLSTRKYQAPDGSDRYVTEVKAFQMQMLDSIGGGQQNEQPNSGSSYKPDAKAKSYQDQMIEKAKGLAQGAGKKPSSSNTFNQPAPNDDDCPF